MLNVAEDDPWTDGGRMKVAPKIQVDLMLSHNVTTIEQSIDSSGYDECA